MGINKAMIAGIVAEEPTFYSNTFYGNALEVKLDINRKDWGKVERITCMIIVDALIDKGLDTIQVGDYLICQSARIVTLEYIREKFFVCPHCGEQSRRLRRATQSDILLYDFELIRGVSLEDSVGINKMLVMGIVRNKLRVRPPETPESVPTKFQLVINRAKGLERHLKESAPEGFTVESFDIPQITCFGRIREQAQQYVRKGDFLLVDGCIQEREFKQQIPFRCKYCGEYSEQYFRYPVHEIIANRITPQRITLENAKEMMSAGSIVNDMGETSVAAENYDDSLDTAIEHMQDVDKAQQDKRAARKETRAAEKAARKAEGQSKTIVEEQ